MRTRSAAHIVLVLLVVTGALATRASAQTTALYDNFNANRIDPDKWLGFENSQGQGASSNEMFRRIVADQAQQLLRVTGNTGDDTGSTGPNARMRIGHPKLMAGTPIIRVLEAQVRVVAAEVDHCENNTTVTSSSVRARLSGSFFNDGTGNDRAGDRTGDIFVNLQKRMRSSDGGPQFFVEGSVFRCTDAACGSPAVIGGGAFTRSWSVGETDLMRVRWDPANDRFEFTVETVGGSHGSETMNVPYVVAADSAKPKRIFHDIEESFTLQNCTAGAVQGFIDMRFDTVRLDQAAVNATLP